MPRRRPGTLVPLESDILEVALSMLRSSSAEFHGFGIARSLQAQGGSRTLTSHGTLYKALGRLEDFGLLSSHWEDAREAEGRPRRRLYALTQRGIETIEQVLAERPVTATPRIAPVPA